MKKYFSGIFCLLSLSVFGQFELTDPSNSNVVVNDQQIVRVVDPSEFDYIAYIGVENKGNSIVNSQIRTTEIDVCTGTQYSSCWKQCPPFSTAGQTEPQMSPVMGTDTDSIYSAALHYKPHGTDCCSLLKYEWLDVDNGDAVLATLYIRFEHNTSTSCEGLTIEEGVLRNYELYPIPAKDQLTIKINDVKSGNYTLYDLAGNTIMSDHIEFIDGGALVDLSSLHKGMYLLSLNTTAGKLEELIIVE